MRKITLALLFACALCTTVCAKGKQPITFANLPEPVQTEVQKNFSVDQIQFIISEKVFRHFEYDFLLLDGTKLKYDERAGLHKASNKNGIPEALVPTKIVEYIHGTFPNAVITEYSFETMKQEVEINNDMELIFDKRGHFIRID